jgi:hypothetical protein
MSVVPHYPSVFVSSAAAHGADRQLDETDEAVVMCGRCRLAFIQPPSAPASDSPKWSLCPPCRSRLLGDENATSARWS